MPKRINIIGTKVGNLTVLEQFHIEGKKLLYIKCLCDCGKTITIRKNALNLTKGTRSCGCYRKEMCKKSSEISAIKRKLPGNEANKRAVFNYYVANAKRKNREFLLSKEQFYELIIKNCYYCNDEPSNKQYLKNDNRNEVFYYNGLDRVDTKKGYVIENVVPCCVVCNRIKLDYGFDFIYGHIKKIINYMENK